MKYIDIKNLAWADEFDAHLKKSIELADAGAGWTQEDDRFDYAYGSESGVHGDIYPEYEDMGTIEPVLIDLTDINFPIPMPYGIAEDDIINNYDELFQFIIEAIIEEIPPVKCGDFPDVVIYADAKTTVEIDIDGKRKAQMLFSFIFKPE